MAGRSALIVATSAYLDTRLAPLDGPTSDAEALQAVLSEADIGGFDVSVALDQPAAVIAERMEAFFANRHREDLLLVHFSGHGLKDDDGQLYLAATDTRIDRLMSTGIEAGWINRLMHRCRSERIALFLDCCFAGSFSTALARRAGADHAGVREAFSGSGLVVIAASDAMQYSFEAGRQVGEPPGPSPFTGALVDGLRTGEADINEDGNVSINELFDYLEERVRETSPAQTPTKTALNQTGDWLIARSTRIPSVRLLPERVQYLLRSERAVDRLEAIIDLERLRSAVDEPRIAAAATKALEELTADDSRRVASRAQDVLGTIVPAATGSGTVGPVAAAPGPGLGLGIGVSPGAREGSPAVARAADVPAGQAPANDAPTSPSVRRWSQSDVLRAVVRAFVASIVALGAAFLVGVLSMPDQLDDVRLEVADPFGGAAPGVVVVTTIFATVLELGRLWLAEREVTVAGVTLSVRWAANRWLEAGAVGVAAALVGILLGAFVGGWGHAVEWLNGFDTQWSFGWAIAFSVAGFLVAEAIIGWRIRHRPEQDVP